MTERDELLDVLREILAWRDHDSVVGLGDYNRGLLCGVEDRDLQGDGYGAMRFGYDAAIERVAERIDVERIRAILGRIEQNAAPRNSDNRPDAWVDRSHGHGWPTFYDAKYVLDYSVNTAKMKPLYAVQQKLIAYDESAPKRETALPSRAIELEAADEIERLRAELARQLSAP